MSPRVDATVAQLDRELAAQAAAAHAALAAEQEYSATLAARLARTEKELAFAREDAAAELAAVRDELGRTRAEVQWLRRAGIDLNAVMAHPAARAARATGRAARAVSRGAGRARRALGS